MYKHQKHFKSSGLRLETPRPQYTQYCYQKGRCTWWLCSKQFILLIKFVTHETCHCMNVMSLKKQVAIKAKRLLSLHWTYVAIQAQNACAGR